MLRITIQHRRFRLKLIAYAPSSKSYLVDFLENLPPEFLVTNEPTNWRLVLISPEPWRPDNPVKLSHVPWEMLHRAWAELEPTWEAAQLLKLDTGTSDQVAWDYVCLLSQKHDPMLVRKFLINYVFRLNREWLGEGGWYLVHASAVVFRNRGFLLLGKSGAGKTTATLLGRGILDAILHDDKVFIAQKNSGFSLMAAPSQNVHSLTILDNASLVNQPSGISCSDYEPPLCAIFLLKKDDADYLVPLSNLTSAHALVQGFLDASHGSASSFQKVRYSMKFLSNIARQVPAFELHFRKRPDFWKVIDEQFPD